MAYMNTIQPSPPSHIAKGVQERKDTIGRHVSRVFEGFAQRTSKTIGTPYSFSAAVFVIVAWAISGPLFHYSDAWQLVINTGTTIITFLMVFLLQHTQNKDSMAIQLKLDEIIAAVEGASNRMINIEELSEADLTELKRRYEALVNEVGRRRGKSDYASTSVAKDCDDILDNADRPGKI